jgi:hypothetical protein
VYFVQFMVAIPWQRGMHCLCAFFVRHFILVCPPLSLIFGHVVQGYLSNYVVSGWSLLNSITTRPTASWRSEIQVTQGPGRTVGAVRFPNITSRCRMGHLSLKARYDHGIQRATYSCWSHPTALYLSRASTGKGINTARWQNVHGRQVITANEFKRGSDVARSGLDQLVRESLGKLLLESPHGHRLCIFKRLSGSGSGIARVNFVSVLVLLVRFLETVVTTFLHGPWTSSASCRCHHYLFICFHELKW